MNRTLAVVAVMAGSLLLAPRAQAQTADEVVEKHLAAMGGRAALTKLTTQIAEGTVSVSTDQADLAGTVGIYKKAPNKARTVIKLDISALGGSEMIIDQRCDGKTALISNSVQGDREVTGAQLQGMLNANFPSLLLNYKDAGAKIEFVGKDRIGDRAVYVLQYTPKTGPGSRQFYDAETYLPIKAVSKVLVPEAGGEIEQTTEFADFRSIDGVKTPFSVTSVSPSQMVVIKLTKVEWNTPIDDAMFSRAGVK